MIELINLSLQRGGKALLEEASLRVNPGEHMALVGANGSGKSSLFKLLCNELSYDSGDLQIPAQWQIAQMRQEVEASDRPAIEYVIDGHQHYRRIEADIEACNDDHRLAELLAEMELIHAYQIRSDAEQLLQGLGFALTEVDKPVSDFSGGWRIRLNLAQALMCPSDLLLLDEPTNHLDLDASLWLEQWLRRYEGTLLLISHDRDFIDACCDFVVHLEHHQLHRYRGNYSAFERQRAERLAQQQQAYEKQQAERAHMEDFVRRFRAKASKAKQAQSRLKALERMSEIAPAHVDSPFHFRFYAPSQYSDPLLGLSNAALGYSEPLLNKVNLSIHPGSRIGLLGANGAGKSTLMKSLAGTLTPLSGQRHSGEHLHMGYFHQHQLESLDLNASPLLQLQRLRPDAREQDIRNFLGGFNFKGERAEGSCLHFSGGEKARLALAIIVWQRPNVLLLDEPTNHLDLEMCHALTSALQEFEGAVIVVSHDRHLLRNTVDELLLVDNGSVSPFDGSLDDYRQWLLSRNRELGDKPQSASTAPVVDKKKARQDAAAKRAKLAPLNNEIKKLERTLQKVAEQLQAIEAQLADTSLYDEANKQQLKTLLAEQARLQTGNNTAEEAWLELQEQLEALAD
ncbi:ATP-binding cassette domain-containing protein [Spongiibacter sp. UBA1325]|uniref:ATP-binding cassette domain-containing protein n=1 Tax=Spongiibacter sp. UBA1325 TaxID=1947543 RepID=UPI002580D8FA|nr:ATP-binding cassette domain-containing protein [Spongiibacter sp. UBA1325]|tara:strand:+ start:18124 stop:20004 length:1881 start_codon:yes stop_codon:yes gene_type:complete